MVANALFALALNLGCFFVICGFILIDSKN